MLDGLSKAALSLLRPEGQNPIAAAMSLQYSHEDLHTATNGFAKENLLGVGAAGAVYCGVIRGGTSVAVKVVHAQPGGLSGFEEELCVLSRFRHPNLVTLLGWGRGGGDPCVNYLVYELLTGGDLSVRLRRSRLGQEPFLWHQRLRAALGAACGLSHMMNSAPKAFHRDVKPQNILLDAHGVAKVADFGLAATIRKRGQGHLTVERISGTPGYADPVYLQSGRVTEQSEVYSFGTLLLELLLGEPPAARGPSGEAIYPLAQLVQPAAPGALERIQAQLDPTARWPRHVVDDAGALALSCVAGRADARPLFEDIVERLRRLCSGSGADACREARAAPASEKRASGYERPAGHGPSWGEGPLRLPAHVASHLADDEGSGAGSSEEDACVELFDTLLAGAPLRPDAGRAVPPPVRKLPVASAALASGGFALSDRCADTCVLAGGPIAEVVFECAHADGVDVAALPPHLRAWGFSVCSQRGRFVVGIGRQCQQQLFETLVPERDRLGSVSRRHFELSFDPQEGADPPTLRRCSESPLAVDWKQLGREGAAAVRSGSSIGFATWPGQASFLVLRVRFRSSEEVRRGGAHPCVAAAAPPRHIAERVEAPLLECTHAQGQGEALPSMPRGSRCLPLPPEGQSLVLGRQEQLGFFEHLLRAEPGWLAFLSRYHCRLGLSQDGGLTVENCSHNAVLAAGQALARGQTARLRDGESLAFLARGPGDAPSEQVEFVRFMFRALPRAPAPLPNTVIKL